MVWIFTRPSSSTNESSSRTFKAGFHYRRSRKRSHKLDGIWVGRIRTFLFRFRFRLRLARLMIQGKLGFRSRKQKRKNWEKGNKARNRTSSLVYFSSSAGDSWQCSFHLIISNGVISRISVLFPTMSLWFSLDRIALYASEYDSDYVSVAR